jgi:hypothetical protein
MGASPRLEPGDPGGDAGSGFMGPPDRSDRRYRRADGPRPAARGARPAERQRRQPMAMGRQRCRAPRAPPGLRARRRRHLAARYPSCTPWPTAPPPCTVRPPAQRCWTPPRPPARPARRGCTLPVPGTPPPPAAVAPSRRSPSKPPTWPLRTGRLTYTDPAWSLSSGPSQPARTPAELIPQAADFPQVVAAVHQASETLSQLAATGQDQIAAAGRARRLLVTTRSLPDTSTSPARSPSPRSTASTRSWPSTVRPAQPAHGRLARSPKPLWKSERPARPWPRPGPLPTAHPATGSVPPSLEKSHERLTACTSAVHPDLSSRPCTT